MKKAGSYRPALFPYFRPSGAILFGADVPFFNSIYFIGWKRVDPAPALFGFAQSGFLDVGGPTALSAFFPAAALHHCTPAAAVL